MGDLLTAAVLRRGEPRFDMAGQRLPDSLHDTDETISAGLVARLRRYALGALTSSGFAVSDWSCEVYTMDGDRPPAERLYTIEFTNDQGGMLGVQGVMTERGWPCLDHGVCIATDRRSGGRP